MFRNRDKELEGLKEQVSKLQQENINLRLNPAQPEKLVEYIVQRGIGWYPYEKLEGQIKANYFADVQQILASQTFNNELNHYIDDLIKFIALESKDFGQVQNVRAGIVILETFRDRLDKIENPSKPIPTTENIHNAI